MKVDNLGLATLPCRRKSRSDRNHIIYQLITPSGERYLGVTYARGRAFKRSIKIRWEAHLRNALEYNRQNLLSVAIREHGSSNFHREILEIVRGKQNAHDRERELIQTLQPELNMEGMGRKINSKRDI
tara:strand:- start:748 stop:1131 length:384 start_codon:yes stop_codon:yes gene_type:complete